MSKGLKSSLIALSACLLVFGGMILTLQSRWLQQSIQKLILRTTKWNVSFTDSSVNPLALAMTLSGVTVSDPLSQPRVAADRLFLNLSLLSLIRGKLIVSKLELDRPVVFIYKKETPSKTKPLDDILEKVIAKMNESLILRNTFLDDIILNDLSLQIADSKTISLKKVVLGAHPTLLRQLALKARLEGPINTFAAMKNLDLELVLKEDGLELKNLELNLHKVAVSLKGNLTGQPQKGSFYIQGKVDAPSVLSQILEVTLEGSHQKKKISLEKIRGVLDGGELTGSGTFDAENKDYDIAWTAKNVSLESIFGKIPSPILKPARGTAELQGRARGRLPDIRIQAQASIQEFKHGSLNSKLASGTIDFHWPDLDFKADVLPDGGRTQGQVQGGITFKSYPSLKKRKVIVKTIDLSFAGGSLHQILPNLKISGNLNGQFSFRGTLDAEKFPVVSGSGDARVTEGRISSTEIARLSTHIELKPGGVVSFSKSVIQMPKIGLIEWPDTLSLKADKEVVSFFGKPMAGLSVEGKYEKDTGLFRIDSFEINEGNDHLKGNLTFSKKEELQGQVRGFFDLKWLSAFSFFLREAEGRVKVDLAATGTTKNPAMKGHAEFLGTNLISLRSLSEFSDVKGVIHIDGSSLNTSGLKGFFGEGEFQLAGRVALAPSFWKIEEYDLKLDARSIRFSKPNAFSVEIDPKVTLKGRSPSPLLSGRIDIVDGRYEKPFAIRELVLKPFEFEPVEEPGAWEKEIQFWELQLAVKNSGDLRIENNIADIDLTSDLKIEGTAGKPRISGTLTATRGDIYFLGKDFELVEGRLEYLDPVRGEPFMTLLAQREIPPDYTIIFELKGYLSNLDVTLSSTPALPREEVVSLMTAGVTQEELRQSGRSQSSIVGYEILAGELSTAFHPISQSTGLDIFRLEAAETGTLSRVALGKNVTDRFSLEFQNDFAPETAERIFQANYYLTDNILLKGFRSWEGGESDAATHYNFNISFRFRLY